MTPGSTIRSLDLAAVDPGDAAGGISRAAAHRLQRAERRGLRIAILCRTLAVGVASVWYLGAWMFVGFTPSIWALGALVAFTAFGLLNLALIGTRYDRWWLKYVIAATDILALCALFALVPLSRGQEVPQILSFRAYGIHFLFPLIALACLALSWRLVVFAGVVAVIGWWSAFWFVASGMERRLSWGDMPIGAPPELYMQLFLSPDFIGIGNRTQETGLLMIAALIMAVAVHRARRVFFAQIAAEAERERERTLRARVSETLGRYVPEAIAARLIDDPAALAPQVRHGAVLVMDISGFTAYAARRDPGEVIATLNAFLSRCADVVAEHGGVVITFTGDGILATFNTPIEIEAPERAALRAAHALLGEGTASGFKVRVGLAAGPIAAGSVGSEKRQAFTVYGDTVNRAARLESLAASLGEAVLLDGAVADAGAVAGATGEDALRPLGDHALKGLAAPVPVFAGPEREPPAAPATRPGPRPASARPAVASALPGAGAGLRSRA